MWNVLHTGRVILDTNETIVVSRTSGGALDRDGNCEGIITKIYGDITNKQREPEK